MPITTIKDWSRLALSPDGKTVLVAHKLIPRGASFHGETQPEPTFGTLVSLIDIETGQEVWELTATVSRMTEYSNPVISPDGRYALVGLAVESTFSNRTALVDMKTGHILQRIPTDGYYPCAAGFLLGGRGVWVSNGTAVGIYDFKP